MSLHAAETHPLSIGDVAEEADVAPPAIRFYERHGLVDSARTSTNQRRFSLDAPCRIKVARVAQRVGLTVREIAGVLDDLPHDAGPEDWERVAAALVGEARARIDQLEAALDDLGSGRKLCELPPPADIRLGAASPPPGTPAPGSARG